MADSADRQALSHRLAARLRELRARRGLTQEQVAKAIQCHESAVSRWESGSRLPPLQDLLSLAQLLDTSCDDLLGNPVTAIRAGAVVLDRDLLDRLEAADTVEAFDSIVLARGQQAAWLPLPEGAALVQVDEAMRRARAVADRFPDSRYADRLFRPRG